MYYDRLKADGISFPIELFVLGAADSEGKLRSELSEAEQWSGKVHAITNAVLQEVGGIKEEMAQLDEKLEQQGKAVLAIKDQLDQKLEQQGKTVLELQDHLGKKLNLEQQAQNMLAMKDQLPGRPETGPPAGSSRC